MKRPLPLSRWQTCIIIKNRLKIKRQHQKLRRRISTNFCSFIYLPTHKYRFSIFSVSYNCDFVRVTVNKTYASYGVPSKLLYDISFLSFISNENLLKKYNLFIINVLKKNLVYVNATFCLLITLKLND